MASSGLDKPISIQTILTMKLKLNPDVAQNFGSCLK